MITSPTAAKLAAAIEASELTQREIADRVGFKHANIEPPQLNWSTTMFRKRRTENGKQATQARRDCLEVTTG
ncbi:hypothetical protein [Lutimaribacter saemankumensis]|uniref:Uncharacterized protein n=1 Tax=Lutimaribacter saemankumensis TaxID=490829 RepID=A0A1G8KBB7_9RHOB|nr:hypothetical protein [Lutimaribacter saemankumensis]SDI40683.1 hypothetical protein SAMN05421850_102478 [Lutimaribacter saemankumensis]